MRLPLVEGIEHDGKGLRKPKGANGVENERLSPCLKRDRRTDVETEGVRNLARQLRTSFAELTCDHPDHELRRPVLSCEAKENISSEPPVLVELTREMLRKC